MDDVEKEQPTMASVNVTIRMDAEDKALAERLFADFGLTMNAGINLYIKQAIREQSIPFKVTKNTEIKRLDRQTLDKLIDESDAKYGQVYKKLAK